MVAAHYAFVSWIGTIIAYLIFLVWAFAPASVLHDFGITYYPDRYYAIALPSYMLVVAILVGISYVGLNLWNTFEPNDIRTIEDKDSIYLSSDYLRIQSSKEVVTPDIGDMDICTVSLILHCKRS